MNNPEKIMFIDDDEISNFVSIRTIEEAFLANDVEAISSAVKAIEQLRHWIGHTPEKIPDLIFLDINMPMMNGWEFIEEYRKIKPQIHKEILIIILTSSVYQHDKKKAKEYAEIKDYIMKPISINDIQSIKKKYYPK
jgi:two-component system, chemotaxis family, chemotaxis protein CheY